MNWLDIVLAILLVASVAASFSKGFVREAVGLAAAILGLIGGAWFYRMAGETVRPYIGPQQVANFCGFFMIFIGVILAGWLVSRLIGLLIKAVGLSWLDRLMGAVFGQTVQVDAGAGRQLATLEFFRNVAIKAL